MVTFEFACRDDCLNRMVPSDLRALVKCADIASASGRLLTPELWGERSESRTNDGFYTDHKRRAKCKTKWNSSRLRYCVRMPARSYGKPKKRGMRWRAHYQSGVTVSGHLMFTRM